MTVAMFTLMVIAGGLGAAVRYVVDALIKARNTSAFPWSTAVINMTGSFVLGLLTGLSADKIADAEVTAVMGIGFLRGYTTFSTASYEAVQLVRDRRYGMAFAYWVGILVVCVSLAFLAYRWGASM